MGEGISTETEKPGYITAPSLTSSDGVHDLNLRLCVSVTLAMLLRLVHVWSLCTLAQALLNLLPLHVSRHRSSDQVGMVNEPCTPCKGAL